MSDATANMTIYLKVWRQASATAEGKFVDYKVDHVSPDMSFLEMFDVLNDQLVKKGESPIAFDHDCREGICGMCSMMINGKAHGGQKGTTTCQLHMRKFKSGDAIVVEPWRAKAFPLIKDLVVDRSRLPGRPVPPTCSSDSAPGLCRQRRPGQPRRSTST